MRRLRLALVLAALAVVASCGFALRGSTNIPFKTLYIGVADTSAIAVELKRSIRGNGPTKIVSDPTKAEAKLEVLRERTSSDIQTINSLGLATEYDLYYHILFRVTDSKGRIYIPPTEIALKRLILSNTNAVLAENFQIIQLFSDMQSDAAQQILRRIEAIQPGVFKGQAPAPDSRGLNGTQPEAVEPEATDPEAPKPAE